MCSSGQQLRAQTQTSTEGEAMESVPQGPPLPKRRAKGPGLPGSTVAGRAARRGKGSHRSAEARPIRRATNPIPPRFSAYLEGDKHGNEGMKVLW